MRKSELLQKHIMLSVTLCMFAGLCSCQQQTWWRQQTIPHTASGDCNDHPNSRAAGTNDEGALSLIRAIVHGDVERAFRLIGNGAPVRFVDGRGNTPLYYAAAVQGEKVPELVRVLVAKGAVVNTKCRGGFTALHVACDTGMPEVVRSLLDVGASVNAADNEGITPLHVAALRDKPDRDEVVQILLRHGADPTLRNREGETAHDLASKEHGDDADLLRLLRHPEPVSEL